jgi:alpha-ketoglutarate-dependent taurine dioxygenase
LSEYIRDGHSRVNQPLTIEQQNALDLLDSLLENKKYIINHHFESGQALFINNYRIAHGRSSFKDYSDKNKKRLLLRTWITN